MIESIQDAWSWIGIEPKEVLEVNPFGNILVKDIRNAIWRICPEDVYCKVIANNEEEYLSLLQSEEFIQDWEMDSMVKEAKSRLGELKNGRCYCLKKPGLIGGEYGGDNLSTISIEEAIGFSGYLAEQIKDLPDGTYIEFDYSQGTKKPWWKFW